MSKFAKLVKIKLRRVLKEYLLVIIILVVTFIVGFTINRIVGGK